jgi:hypothetical protein
MNKKLFSRQWLFFLAFGLIGVSCLAGNELSGTWECVMTNEILEFTKGNNFTYKRVKEVLEGTYSLKDDTIELSIGGETRIMSISKDRKTLTPKGEKFQFIRK